MKPKTEKSIEITITIKNPYGFSSKEFGTFIPYKLAIKVGNINIIEMDVIRFITIFKLLEITEAKVPIMLLKIPL